MNQPCSAVASEERARHRLGSAALCYGRVWFPLWSRALGIRHHRSADEGGVALVPQLLSLRSPLRGSLRLAVFASLRLPPHYKAASVPVAEKYPGTIFSKRQGYGGRTPALWAAEGGGFWAYPRHITFVPLPFCFRTPGILLLHPRHSSAGGRGYGGKRAGVRAKTPAFRPPYPCPFVSAPPAF